MDWGWDHLSDLKNSCRAFFALVCAYLKPVVALGSTKGNFNSNLVRIIDYRLAGLKPVVAPGSTAKVSFISNRVHYL